MNKHEKRVIHGLYFHREMIDEEMIYDAAEINWLANTRIPRTKRWAGGGSDGRLQRLAAPGDGDLKRLGAVAAAAQASPATVPLLVMDMYEHSYHMDFGSAAGQYVDAFFNSINWEQVLARTEALRLFAA